MYNEYFGLEHTPFRLTPDTRLFFPGGGRGEVLDALIYAITSGEGIIKVVGEVGTGKTMLCRMLEERLPNTVDVVYLANPSLTPEDILHAIALELELELSPSASRIQIMHALQQALLERHAHNRRVVALVEEAQSMPRDTLEEIRLLSNLETKSEKLLQIVLFGQPELDENLAAPEIRQLRERITHGFNLQVLSTVEIREYMEFRLRAAGYRGREAFSSKAYKVMHKASEGLTRRVNILADKSLLAAFADDTHDVSERHVKVAIQDTQLSVPRGRTSTSPLLIRVGSFVLAAGLGWGAASWYVSGDGKHVSEQSVAGSAQQVTTEQTTPLPASEIGVAGTPPGEPLSPDPAPVADTSAPVAVVANPGRAEALKEPLIEDQKAAGKIASAASLAENVQAGSNPQAAALAPIIAAPRPEIPRAAALTNEIDGSQQLRLPASESVQPSEPAGFTQAPQPPTGARQVAGTDSRRLYSRSTQPATAAPRITRTASAAPPAAELSSDQTQAAITVAAAPASIPAPATLPASRSGGAGPGNLLEQRLDKTRVWLKGVNPRNYSIQVLATAVSRQQNLLNFLKRRVGSGRIKDIYVYKTTIDNRPWYGVLYGEFSEYSKARQALRELPSSMTRHRPFIRNISDIAAD